MTFAYDGLNRQVGRGQGDPMSLTFSVWDGWSLIEEYRSGNNVQARYLNGPNGVVKNLTSGNLYFQDGSGSASHLTDSNGNLREWYLYDLQGNPGFFDASGNQLLASAFGVRHLFTGQQWYSDSGLYDLRNRFYSPDIGRFLQPDPIDFNGDPTNLYRYCGNNPVIFGDPLGLWTFQVGLSFNVRIGPTMWNFNHGLAVDGHGNLATFTTYAGGIGAGAQASAGVSFTGSSADTVSGLARWYYNVNGGAGLGPSGSANAFWGDDATNPKKRVYGGGITVSFGIGGGGSGGPSYTFITPWSPSHGAPAPGGTGYAGDYGGYFDADGNVVLENRVTVSATPVYQGGSSGGPTWGNGVGIFDTTGFNAQYAPNFYSYTGSLPTTLANPFGSWGPSFGGPIQGSIFGPGNWYSGLDPVPGAVTIGMGIWVMEPADSCFVAGTPVLMADGSEKPIEAIQVGEAVLAWNEETKTMFATKVVRALHHEEKMQTLFDIELEDGRKFTVNNDHPMYVVEDGDFTITDELAARFAKGQPVTFQDSKNQPVKIVSLRMHRQVCKTYNLYVEGQGQKGHTYYANGILVHNRGVNRWK